MLEPLKTIGDSLAKPGTYAIMGLELIQNLKWDSKLAMHFFVPTDTMGNRGTKIKIVGNERKMKEIN